MRLKPRQNHWLALCLAGLLSLPALARAQNGESGGIGGTGIAPETGGVGGTGIQPETGGVGGTGVQPESGGIGGTGVERTGRAIIGYGPIQAFGSVFVNGREYVYNSHTLITIDGAPAPASALHVGDIADVRGTITSPRGGFASTITVLHPLIGPIGTVAPDGRSVTMLGQSVVSGNGTALFGSLKPGDAVAISAQLRADGNWVATAVAPAARNDMFQLAGRIETLHPGSVSVAGTVITAPAALTAALSPGQAVVVTGALNDATPRATAIIIASPLAAPAGTLVEIKDYFRATGGGMAVASDGVTAAHVTDPAALKGTQPVELLGTMTSSGIIDVDDIGLDSPSAAEISEPATKLETGAVPPAPEIEPGETRPEPPEIELPETGPDTD